MCKTDLLSTLSQTNGSLMKRTCYKITKVDGSITIRLNCKGCIIQRCVWIFFDILRYVKPFVYYLRKNLFKRISEEAEIDRKNAPYLLPNLLGWRIQLDDFLEYVTLIYGGMQITL